MRVRHLGGLHAHASHEALESAGVLGDAIAVVEDHEEPHALVTRNDGGQQVVRRRAFARRRRHLDQVRGATVDLDLARYLGEAGGVHRSETDLLSPAVHVGQRIARCEAERRDAHFERGT